MPLKSWPGTPPSANRAESRSGREAGSITLIVVFTYFLMSVLGLGLFMLTRTYRLWSTYKNDAVLLREAAENGVRAGFGALDGILAARAFPLTLTENEFETLRAATMAGQSDAAAAALGAAFPLIVQEMAGWSEWTSETAFRPVCVADSETFFAAEFTGTIDARGRLIRRARAKRTVLDIGLSLMAGRVPLSAFPFLLAGDNAREQASELLAGKSVVIAAPESGGGQIPPAAADHLLVPNDATPQLAETLRIRILLPGQADHLSTPPGAGAAPRERTGPRRRLSHCQ